MVSLVGIAAAITGALFLSLSGASAAPNMNVKNEDCSGFMYGDGTLYSASIAFILNDMMTTTFSFLSYDHTTQSSEIPMIYGHAHCSGNLSTDDCTSCLMTAKSLVEYLCRNRVMAKMELQDCSMTYDCSMAKMELQACKEAF